MTGVEVRAPAKVNLWLRVLAREATGYHSLETLFCALELADSLRIERAAEGVHLAVEGEIPTGRPDQNLALRAAALFLNEIGREGDGLRIVLRKRIPAAAGLGGGSSDAAATLLALRRLYEEAVSRERLLQLAIQLGSDVPFFLTGSPLALGWSRGERLLALPPLPPVPVLVAHPGEAMATAGAFQAIAAARGGDYTPQSARLELSDLASWRAVAARAWNDFEPVACRTLPRLRDGLGVLRDSGALIALLAGSGASIFGVYEEGNGMQEAATALRRGGFTVWTTSTLATMPEPVCDAPGTG